MSQLLRKCSSPKLRLEWQRRTSNCDRKMHRLPFAMAGALKHYQYCDAISVLLPRDHPRTRDYLGTAKSPYTRHVILRDMRIVSSLHAERDRSCSPKRTESHSFIFTSECWDDGSSPSRIRFTDACWRL